MTSPVFDRIAEIIAENSEVPADKIKPEAHVINDLGIDSLDFLSTRPSASRCRWRPGRRK
jgi:acyl carrier protein